MGDNIMPFKLVAITPESIVENEAEKICRILDAGFDYIHLRKPRWNEEQMRHYITSIPAEYRCRLKIHDFPTLAQEFELAGIHLNSRHPNIPSGYRRKISKSCHSIKELDNRIIFEYVFLSPIFDSICKRGYCSRFTGSMLEEASDKIDSQVIALGGITSERMNQIKKWGFGGCAFLGYLFNTTNFTDFEDRLKSIINNKYL